MRFLSCLAAVVLLLLALAGCQDEPLNRPADLTVDRDLATPWVDPERAAFEIMNLSAFPFDAEVELPAGLADAADKSLACVLGIEREDLGGGVAHYAYTLKVGSGQYDRIKLHRVIKETRPGRPVRTDGNIFLQHGDAVGFVKFLFGPAAPSVADDFAAAIHLAKGGVDVWGIDQNWVLVPGDTADFGFMADWGMDNQVANLRSALAVARFVRLFSGEGFGRMNLLGYSSGGGTGYALLNLEAGLPAALRHVGGYVSADMLYKYDPVYERIAAAHLRRCGLPALPAGQRGAGGSDPLRAHGRPGGGRPGRRFAVHPRIHQPADGALLRRGDLRGLALLRLVALLGRRLRRGNGPARRSALHRRRGRARISCAPAARGRRCASSTSTR